MQERNSPSFFHEPQPHTLRVTGEIVKNILSLCKQLIVNGNKLLPVGFCHPVQIADHPALIFELPFTGKPRKPVITGHIRKEGELAAGQCAEIALAVGGAFASQQNHPLGDFILQSGGLTGIRTFISPPQMPQVRIIFQVIPFLVVNCRHGVANVATKRLSTCVERGAFPSAIQTCD
jgi:hypothetical protein